MTRRTGLVLLALLAAGCGQTGELFLPGERPPARGVPATPAETAPDDEASADEPAEEDDEETPAR